MQINIKSVGYKVGTSGWIKEQLTAGTAKITEGLSIESKKHGLWLEYNNNGPKGVCLAIWDQYSIGAALYQVIDDLADNQKWAILTPAVQAMLTSVAQQWANELNTERANDPDIGATIARVSVTLAA